MKISVSKLNEIGWHLDFYPVFLSDPPPLGAPTAYIYIYIFQILIYIYIFFFLRIISKKIYLYIYIKLI